jgi:predicted aminopeptidase
MAAVSGCHTLRFYGQAIKGQYQLIANQEPVTQLLARSNTPSTLKARLQMTCELRGFGSEVLKLPVNGHYKKYVDVHRPYVVWNVEAAPEFSMAPKTWWYPLVGSLEYRGYFSSQGATNYAFHLRKKGYDVAVGGVQAYSTLGWFKDPLLNTFIYETDAELAEIIFHELAHQRVFARGDTDFNEAFATTVGQEGARRWLNTHRKADELADYLKHLRRNDDFVHLVMHARSALENVFGDVRNEDGKLKPTRKNHNVSAGVLRKEKEQILEKLKTDFAQLKAQWGGETEFDWWFAHPINNAHLNSVAAYYDFVPGFEQLLVSLGGDLERFYEAAERLSRKSKKEREQTLRALARTQQQAMRDSALARSSAAD